MMSVAVPQFSSMTAMPIDAPMMMFCPLIA
jgi:hypothetical protein